MNKFRLPKEITAKFLLAVVRNNYSMNGLEDVSVHHLNMEIRAYCEVMGYCRKVVKKNRNTVCQITPDGFRFIGEVHGKINLIENHQVHFNYS